MDEGKQKYFIIFAYPGMSGYLHVGHLRSYTYPDIVARYKRMRGFNVLFPAAFHASGIPAVTLAKSVQRRERETIRYLRMNGCSDTLIERLEDPVFVVKFFSEEYIKIWQKMGYSLDLTRTFSTIDLAYNHFIEWQFHKLQENGLLIQKPHFAPYCPNCGPIAVDPSETDISKGGNASILEFTILAFESGEYVLPAATLRPETVFGVTNVWLNPDQVSFLAQVESQKWVLSPEAYEKIKFQLKDVKKIGSIGNKELLGKTCKVPIINREVPILPAVFLKPSVGTGVVMSVPSHAPYDWVALEELKRSSEGATYNVCAVNPISIIATEGFGEHPSQDLVKHSGIRDQNDIEKLDKITELLYRNEYHKGVMNQNCGEYSGLRVSDAKEKVKENVLRRQLGARFYDFSDEVVCRCGGKAVIKLIPNQWFIRYSDEKLKKKANDCVGTMTIRPVGYKENLTAIIDWYDDRPCVRQGSWLGTEFPFDRDWIIEPISDSTLYPAFYIVTKYLNTGILKAGQLMSEFFDYVFLGEGDVEQMARKTGVDVSIAKSARRDFKYWYPLDLNCGGKEHQTVHFPVFIFNHVAIMERRNWPLGIFVNWWTTGKSGKISKSKGGAEPIPKVAEEYTVDGVRLYYAHSGNPHADVVWDPDIAKVYHSRVEQLWVLISSTLSEERMQEESIDRWLVSRINRSTRKVTDAIETFEFREAAQEVFYTLASDLTWYLKRGGKNKKTIRYFLEKWIPMMAPFTPYLAEEAWEKIGKKPFISTGEWPIPEEKKVNDTLERGETYIRNLHEDVKSIVSATGIHHPKVLYLYTAEAWKLRLISIVKKNEGDITRSIREAAADPELKEHREDLKELIRISAEKHLFEDTSIPEETILKEAKDFLEHALGMQIRINENYDPQNKAKRAFPSRPGIYIE